MSKIMRKTDNYKALLAKVKKEFNDLEYFVKRRTVEGYWRIGRYIDENLLENKERAQYGATLLEKLAKDSERDITTLQRAVQFYRTYPILVPGRELTWAHYRRLITVKDKEERTKLENQIIKNNWNSHEVQQRLNAKRRINNSDDKPIPQLKFSFGKLHTYKIVKSNCPSSFHDELVLDLGFRLKFDLPSDAKKHKENEIVTLQFEEGELYGAKKKEVKDEELFTYQAKVDKVIDGDTLLVTFNFGLAVTISQKLRLRGINCPEMDTEEGKKAKKYVESCLKDCEYIIVKTYKDKSDKFDRYLADVFYGVGQKDLSLVASEGNFLNQELLNHRLASNY